MLTLEKGVLFPQHQRKDTSETNASSLLWLHLDLSKFAEGIIHLVRTQNFS